MRIFISHSSKDKTRYCNEVVKKLIEKLGKDSIVYDALTFEAGEKSIDEINRTLAFTDLYVILLSQTAVESDWVKYELSEAQKKLTDRALDRVYPLIIDPTLKHSDERIPAWLKDYNLKYIVILSRLVDTFISKISLTMLPVPKPHNTACVLSWEEARRWQSRSSGYSSS